MREHEMQLPPHQTQFPDRPCPDILDAAVQGVANRDLKLENLLLHRDVRNTTSGRRPLLKICDFGYSKHELNSPATTGVGTPIYMAPEIIYGISRYDAKVRSW